ncbi:multidrug effflux MFS transporter [Stigmatella sp. ncwal1]|uniref:Multidrug effflux MFS transporter n=1 Tax=Stigmatella ashevillensis TaxID=2995309 RepID=A0ABT5DLV5_9BACT|nr:multidrug effflux MFS transporter [Stigmatella ashevillena]MDC0714574.1 multidrug effflux MFS transporter [Stigmatella ashevillena]
MTTPENAPRAPSTFVLELILGALTAFGPLSIDMYLPALPNIGVDLHASTSAVQLTLATFFVGLALGQFGVGPLIDHFGRTKPLYAGLALYVAGSAGCALAPNVEALSAFRFVQAIGGAVAIVVPRAVVRDLQSGVGAARMMSRLVLVMGVAPILAPLLGGALLSAFGWRSIFWTLAAAGLGALAIVFFTLPETAPPRHGRTAQPPPFGELLRDPSFVGHALTGGMLQAAMFAYIAGSSFVFITLHHVPAEHFGWFFGANAAGLILNSQINRRLLSRFSPSQLLQWAVRGALLMAVVVWVIAFTGWGQLWGMAGALFLFMSTLGFNTPNSTALALENHGKRAGVASAILGSLQFTIAALASWAVSATHNGTAVPMASVILVATVLGWAALKFASSRGKPRAEDKPSSASRHREKAA